ncbi:LacI family DNA-binding transcriptional regulator [Bacillus sp. T33-2]|uniref:LacI family DNA-binding transcriptional regulator n=1 Tax=Bacillus sp. T33-2 TaxID=2054168 RepID=UPI000C7743EA|nr:LacI family DNA-binding transcriptional regulator [Bacillus sp. T33-2]PLR95730.1 LacI family transcriptional regulator [Bacillus sp. T33-2]
MATIKEVAEAAGVSKSTVSNVFSKKRPISKEVSERVLQIAKELNYKPNYFARSLTMKETKIIGLKMQAEKIKFSQFHLSLLNGVLHECHEMGYQLLVNTLSQQHQPEIQNQVSIPVDGEIIMDPSYEDPRLSREAIKAMPTVIIGKPPPAYEHATSYVDNDNIGIAYEVASSLLDNGHENIMFLNAPRERTVSIDREAGFKWAHMDHKKEYEAGFILYHNGIDTSVDFGFNSTLEMLQQHPYITAIIVDTDKMALGVYRAAKMLSLAIPEQLSVFAFSDDSIFQSELIPPLSSVKLNAELLGSEAAKLLIDQIDSDKKLVKKIIIPADLNYRESTSVATSKSKARSDK